MQGLATVVRQPGNRSDKQQHCRAFPLQARTVCSLLAALLFAGMAPMTPAAPALKVLGKDFVFPLPQPGLPARLSDFSDLQINQFQTDDGVTLRYWEAGSGKPLVFIPGWSASGAEYINVLYLLSKHYHVYVLDPRNQGLSQRVDYGAHISRFAADLKAFANHLGLQQADYCGWSMGAAVLWSYIDLFGTQAIHKAVFVDEPPSIYTHADWSEQERLDAGGMTTSAERMVAAFTSGASSNQQVVDMKVVVRAMASDSPYYANSRAFSLAVIPNTPQDTARVLFEHASSDWRDVLRHKVNVPTAIFSGDYSSNLPSQRWMASVIPHASLYVYSRAEQGDHFLMFKNPLRFSQDLQAFLAR
jgi:pimeloyl-ACP methyl ester carboxylesterase